MSTSKTILMLNFRGAVWLALESRCNVREECPGVQASTEELLDLQGKCPQSTRTTHTDEQEVEQAWQEADLAEHGIPD